jgi:hypothetical protein
LGRERCDPNMRADEQTQQNHPAAWRHFFHNKFLSNTSSTATN